MRDERTSSRITRIRVTSRPDNRSIGRLMIGSLTIPCALGRSGISRRKREGDAATPSGSFRILNGYSRTDRISRLKCALPFLSITASSGWCDDPISSCYNRPIALPFKQRHETLWRSDRVYDVLLVLDYNIRPRIKGCGSAIFFHLARDDFSATEGCIAIRMADMRRLVPRLSRRAYIEVR